MSSHGNNAVWINMNFQKWKVNYNTACAENTEKRLKSQVKLQIIIMKVHKIIYFTHTKISTPAIIFWSSLNFVDPHDPEDLCQSLTHPTHEPTHQHYPRLTCYLADS